MKALNTLLPTRRFFNLLKVDKQDIFSIYVYALFNGIVTLSLPLGIQAIINLISAGEVSTSWIILVILVIVGIGLTGVMQIMQLTISENLQQKIFTRSAFEFAYRIPRMKPESTNKFYMPEFVNRFFDTLTVQKGLSKILMDFSTAVLQVMFGLILLSFYHSFFIIFSLILVLIVFLIFRLTFWKGLKTSILESDRKYEVAHWLQELARAKTTFMLSGNSPLPLNKTDILVGGYLNSRKAHFKTLLLQYINLVGFRIVVAAGLLVIGGLLVINQQMNIGQFVAAEIIIILILASVEKLVVSMETIYDVLTAVDKMGKVTDIPLETDSGSIVSINEKEGIAIKLQNISYHFDGSGDTLKNISLNISSGEKMCVSGYNGSGKSVLIQLLAGLYDQFSGSISYNDIPLKNWSKENLRSFIGVSISTEDIFKGTLFENITLSNPEISINEIQKIAAIVGLTEFVALLPDGLQTQMISEGRNLPRNIRLKVILARCLAGNPRIILLEDNFNQLTTVDKNRFLEYILMNHCTVVAVSNDPEVARQFDRVATLEGGELVSCKPFQEIENQ